MNCIIVDDEPLARKAIELLVRETGSLNLSGSFNSASSAAHFMKENPVELIFLDIQMPKVTGLEFARSLPQETFVIFTTAYTEYAIESYNIDAIDYLVKPVELPRFQKAVNKVLSYYTLLQNDKKEEVESIEEDYMFVKSDRRYFKIDYKDILFIEGLKDYSIIQCINQRIITRINLKNIFEELPESIFFRVSKSYIVNIKHIQSFDTSTIYINQHDILLGNNYREKFLDYFLSKKKKQ